MITDSDILKNDFTKEWIFNPGEPIGKILNPKDATESEVESQFLQNEFSSFRIEDGIQITNFLLNFNNESIFFSSRISFLISFNI